MSEAPESRPHLRRVSRKTGAMIPRKPSHDSHDTEGGEVAGHGSVEGHLAGDRSGPPMPELLLRSGQMLGARRIPPQRSRRDPFPLVLGGVIGALLVGILLVGFLLVSRNGSAPIPPTGGGGSLNSEGAADKGGSNTAGPAAAGAASPEGATVAAAQQPSSTGPGIPVPEEGKNHVEETTPIAYKNDPPSSGTHYGSTADYGFSEQDFPLGKLVHNMEHGAVVIYYKPGLDSAMLQHLRGAFKSLPAAKYGKVKLVIAPYAPLKTPLALAAWGHIQPLPEFDYNLVLAFYQAYVDKGPEDVP